MSGLLSTPKIYIIHENDKWLEPLRAALDALGLKYEDWHFGKGGKFDLSSIPPIGVFYNRMSPSSHTRRNRYAIEHTTSVLGWLELHGRRVINGSQIRIYNISLFYWQCVLLLGFH